MHSRIESNTSDEGTSSRDGNLVNLVRSSGDSGDVPRESGGGGLAGKLFDGSGVVFDAADVFEVGVVPEVAQCAGKPAVAVEQ
jgi:hypothetical protein